MAISSWIKSYCTRTPVNNNNYNNNNSNSHNSKVTSVLSVGRSERTPIVAMMKDRSTFTPKDWTRT